MDAEELPADVVAESAHLLWFVRLSSKSTLWRCIVPAMRAGLDDAHVIIDCRAALLRLEALAADVIERWPHLEDRVAAILAGKD